MRRLVSTNHPAQTRLLLRERLSRFLPHEAQTEVALQPPGSRFLPDSQLLELLLNVDVAAGDDALGARQLYESSVQHYIETMAEAKSPAVEVAPAVRSGEARDGDPEPAIGAETSDTSSSAQNTPSGAEEPAVAVKTSYGAPSASLEGLSPPPTFDELVQRGWIRLSLSRFDVPRDIVFAALRTESEAVAPFKAIVARRGETTLSPKAGWTAAGELRNVVEAVVGGELLPSQLTCVSKAWVAAKLWEALHEDQGLDAMQKALSWVDRWRLLGCPRFALSSHVAEDVAAAFFDSAFTLISEAGATPDWSGLREAATASTTLLHPHTRAQRDSLVHPVPSTLIERVAWMSEHLVERAFHDFLDSRASDLLSVLIHQLQTAHFDRFRLGPRLIEAAASRPVYLQQLSLRAMQEPALLADMLMEPATCPLACSIVAGWTHHGSSWFRELEARTNRATSLISFEDAVSVLGGHLDSARVSSDELIPLYVQVFEHANHHRPEARRPEMLTLLREEISGSVTAVREAVVDGLLVHARQGNSSLAAFCALLDLAAEGGCAELMPSQSIVGFYLDTLLPRGEKLIPGYLEATSAAALVQLAFRCDEATRDRFFDAVDVPAWLRGAPASGSERFRFTQDLLGRVRLHVRVLARAIADWPNDVEPVLAAALARAVRAGACDRPSHGQLDALSLGLHFGMGLGVQEPPLANDLSRSLGRLQGNARQELLNSLCLAEEPAFLAGIVANVPPDFGSQVKARLQALTPSNSSQAYTLPALQARVSALLEAGMPDVAARFVQAERNAAPRGRVPRRALAALRSELLARYLTEDWSGIMSFQLPESVPEAERQDANDTLAFYRALAHLKMPNGDVSHAEVEFLRLSRRHPATSSYLANLFATRVQRLLANDSLGLLAGERLAEARRILSEVQRDVRPALEQSAQDLNALDVNRAMLLLAVGRPRDALQLLLELREREYEPKVEGFRALALARVGSKREALALLTQAESVFGRLPLLTAVRENIDGRQPFRSAPAMSLGDDPVPGLRQAYEAILRLSHAEQAEVFEARGRLDLYLIDHVRGACASLVELVPMMGSLNVLSRENDINSVFKQLLLSRLLHVQWDVGDQSRGGYSRTGGVGERDLLVSKGAATLAVIEALIVDSVERTNLTSHFTKLLGYSTCKLFFHVTYARRADCSRVVNYLKAACQTPPAGVSYLRSEDLPNVDSMPVGFKALYTLDARDALVTFLVLDMNQRTQRGAAAAAGAPARATSASR